MTSILRAEVWIANFDPVKGHEQGGDRPALILSTDAFNASGGQDVFLVPITSRYRVLRTRVHIKPPEGGLNLDSYAQCDKMRSLSSTRLARRLGYVSPDTLRAVEEIVRRILGFH